MSELIYRILDFEKTNNALKKALLRCNELENSSLAKNELNIELNCVIYDLNKEIETAKKTEYNE